MAILRLPVTSPFERAPSARTLTRFLCSLVHQAAARRLRPVRRGRTQGHEATTRAERMGLSPGEVDLFRCRGMCRHEDSCLSVQAQKHRCPEAAVPDTTRVWSVDSVWRHPDTAARWRRPHQFAVRNALMIDLGGLLPLRWRCKHLSASNSNVPRSPGVYVIGHFDSYHGLEFGRTYVYVGETRNLQRRLDEHLPDTEQNPGLRDYLWGNYSAARCWFAPMDSSRIKGVQDDLIRKIEPRFNAIGVPTNKEEGEK